MFVKATKVRSGRKTYTYLQLVESVWKDGRPTHHVIASLGRVDRVDHAQIDRLVTALAPYTRQVQVIHDPPRQLGTSGGKEIGPILVLTHLWRFLSMDELIRTLCEGQKVTFDPERAIRAMVFNRVCDPKSELQVMRWIRRVAAPEFKELELQHLYHALDLAHVCAEWACFYPSG